MTPSRSRSAAHAGPKATQRVANGTVATVANGYASTSVTVECLKCGYSPHADYNAAKNIGLKHLRSAQTSSGGDAPLTSSPR